MTMSMQPPKTPNTMRMDFSLCNRIFMPPQVVRNGVPCTSTVVKVVRHLNRVHKLITFHRTTQHRETIPPCTPPIGREEIREEITEEAQEALSHMQGTQEATGHLEAMQEAGDFQDPHQEEKGRKEAVDHHLRVMVLGKEGQEAHHRIRSDGFHRQLLTQAVQEAPA